MKQNTVARAIVLACLLAPAAAHAAGIGEAAAQRLIDLMTGTLARLVGILALVAVGFSGWTGRMAWDRAVHWAVGTVVIFGAAEIMGLVMSK